MEYGNLPEFARERALDTFMLLQLLQYLDKLDETHLNGRVLDFGSAYGTNTQALNNFGGYVEAVDISNSVNEIIRCGILPVDRVYHQDGIALMRDRPNTYDLITSFLFGPISTLNDKAFLREFYNTARMGLKSSGKILLTSDIGSFSHIEELVHEGYGKVFRFPTFPMVFISGKA